MPQCPRNFVATRCSNSASPARPAVPINRPWRSSTRMTPPTSCVADETGQPHAAFRCADRSQGSMKFRHLLLLPLLVATVALSGCGLWSKLFNRAENVQPPKPLAEFTPSVQVQKLWSTRIGDGSGRSGVRLQPTFADGKLYLISTD